MNHASVTTAWVQKSRMQIIKRKQTRSHREGSRKTENRWGPGTRRQQTNQQKTELMTELNKPNERTRCRWREAEKQWELSSETLGRANEADVRQVWRNTGGWALNIKQEINSPKHESNNVILPTGIRTSAQKNYCLIFFKSFLTAVWLNEKKNIVV